MMMIIKHGDNTSNNNDESYSNSNNDDVTINNDNYDDGSYNYYVNEDERSKTNYLWYSFMVDDI